MSSCYWSVWLLVFAITLSVSHIKLFIYTIYYILSLLYVYIVSCVLLYFMYCSCQLTHSFGKYGCQRVSCPSSRHVKIITTNCCSSGASVYILYRTSSPPCFPRCYKTWRCFLLVLKKSLKSLDGCACYRQFTCRLDATNVPATKLYSWVHIIYCIVNSEWDFIALKVSNQLPKSLQINLWFSRIAFDSSLTCLLSSHALYYLQRSLNCRYPKGRGRQEWVGGLGSGSEGVQYYTYY